GRGCLGEGSRYHGGREVYDGPAGGSMRSGPRRRNRRRRWTGQRTEHEGDSGAHRHGRFVQADRRKRERNMELAAAGRTQYQRRHLVEGKASADGEQGPGRECLTGGDGGDPGHGLHPKDPPFRARSPSGPLRRPSGRWPLECDEMANRLARETSPYLLEHAENPVDWYAWGAEALARARTENKPILLSIGYSACHWCHVMARESFEDPETAALMNRD